ncbi:MAG: hypothetical protein PHD21_05665 [Flavobacteriales bacterium]|nr:hypothetical protein [Flavobacteriales bacterium]
MGFYNIENLFDTVNDPNKDDDQYTPYGKLAWTTVRFNKKVYNISRVISEIKPDIMGIAETENYYTTSTLTHEITKRTKLIYKYIHMESGDERGIDPAFIYRDDAFKIISYDTLRSMKNTRSLLYIKGIITQTKDTLHVFVNHWTSRYAGQKATEDDRKDMAFLLSKKMNDILDKNKKAKIVAFGDFNDDPTDVSIQLFKSLTPCISDHSSIEISPSYYYKDTWYAFDQIFTNFVSGKVSTTVFHPQYMLSQSGKPLRTYSGETYTGGFSDHLPIYIDLTLNNK